ncbi:TPA: glycosyltransferase, partial [Enterococcus faecalis]|nr:glycosyltransferase [Enterococcus faecalis]
MPKISIIVPVYNVEKYLEKCVRSILAQTFTDFELILVDDGSPDSSGAMCDQFAEQDQRVKVIHKENGGLSDARNAGIEIATGEYLGFVDSDDYIADDMYELLYTNIVKEDADLSICGIYDVYEGKEPVEKQQQYIVLDKVAAMKMILEAKV